MSTAADRVLQARERRSNGLCISNPRPEGCKIMATDGVMCRYCTRLMDGESVTIARRRRKWVQAR